MINRRRPSGNFTVIANELLCNKMLKAEPLSVLLFLLSKPPSFEVRVHHVSERFGLGRNKTYALINELIALG